MKKLIVSRADNNIKDMTDLTFPYIKEYAEICECDFKVLDQEPPIWSDDNRPHFRIMALYDLFNDYDRILCIDSDVVLNKSIPNIFDIVPYEKVGITYEDKGTRASARRAIMIKAQKIFGDIEWREGYINTGFCIFSKIHKDIFQPINGFYYTDWGSDDVHLGYQLRKNNISVQDLGYKWNHMTMFSEGWNGSPDRFDSYVIHYAGAGIFNGGKCKNRIDQIKHDISKIYK